MRAEAEQLVLGEQGRQLGERPLGIQAAARSPGRDTNSGTAVRTRQVSHSAASEGGESTF